MGSDRDLVVTWCVKDWIILAVIVIYSEFQTKLVKFQIKHRSSLLISVEKPDRSDLGPVDWHLGPRSWAGTLDRDLEAELLG